MNVQPVQLIEEGFPHLTIDMQGNIFNTKTGKYLKPTRNNIQLNKDCKVQHFTISELIGNKFGYPIDHISDEHKRQLDLPFLDKYIVVDDGRVWNWNTKQWIVGSINNSGYVILALKDSRGVLRHFKMHRLVAMAFIPNPENKEQVNHIDGNKTNNHVSNLEWVSCYDNLAHARSYGLKRAAMTEEQIHQVCKLLQEGKGVRETSKIVGVSESAVGHIVNHGCHRHIAEQYGIKYKKPVRLTPIDYTKYKKRYSGPRLSDMTCVHPLIAGRGLEPISHNGSSDTSHDGYKK